MKIFDKFDAFDDDAKEKENSDLQEEQISSKIFKNGSFVEENEENKGDSEANKQEEESKDDGFLSSESYDDEEIKLAKKEPIKNDSLKFESLKTKDDNKMKDSKGKNTNNDDIYSKVSKDLFKIIGLIVSGLLVVLSIWTLAKSFTPAITRENVVLDYTTNDQVDYRIYLSKNDFYETPTLGVGEIVPVTFIDRIEIDFSSFLSATKPIDMNYSYKVTGVIVANAADNGSEAGGRIWSKNYEFVPLKTFTDAAVTGYTVQEKVVIDYKQYNDLVNQYKLRAGIPMDAALTVTLTVDANSVVDGSVMNESNSVSVSIPLSVSTVQMSTSDDGNQPRTLVQTEKIAASNNIVLLIISVIILVGSLATTVMLLKSLRKMTEEHSTQLKFNKIMRDYSQIIIEIEKLPEVKNAAIIEVKAFKDMLDVQKELHLPIMCCNSKDNIVTNNVFYIVNQNQIFKYKMNSDVEKF